MNNKGTIHCSLIPHLLVRVTWELNFLKFNFVTLVEFRSRGTTKVDLRCSLAVQQYVELCWSTLVLFSYLSHSNTF